MNSGHGVFAQGQASVGVAVEAARPRRRGIHCYGWFLVHCTAAQTDIDCEMKAPISARISVGP